MIKIPKDRIEVLKDKFPGRRIAVIGDLMLDCYFWGEVKRISPEAPVPVIEVDNEFYRFGGAANVALNILKLGCIPVPIGVLGSDHHAEIFRNLIKETSIPSDGIFVDESRPTTAKTRVIANNQHIVRIDQEKKNPISDDIQNNIIKYVKRNINNLEGIILQDYNKGVLSPKIIDEIINIAKENKVIITVDPKFSNFFRYKDVTVFKPNKKETEEAFGIKINSDADLKNAGENLLNTLKAKYVILTLGEQGIAIFEGENKMHRIPTKARKVADVSGAGDTVISTLTVALASGATICEASYLANFAGGIVCEEVGIIPIEASKLFYEVEKEMEEN